MEPIHVSVTLHARGDPTITSLNAHSIELTPTDLLLDSQISACLTQL